MSLPSATPPVLIIQYDEPHPAGRDRRGVLLSALHGKPTVPWKDLMTSFTALHTAMDPNVVRFRLPYYAYDWPKIEGHLRAQFRRAFPDKEPAVVRVFENEKGYRRIDIVTPFENVPASDIIRAAAQEGWSVVSTPISPPHFVGFQTSALVHAIKLDNVPLESKEQFISYLPQLFGEFIEPPVEFRVVGIWEMQGRVSISSCGEKVDTWLFSNSLVVLLELKQLPGSGRIADFVKSWPGWMLWPQEVLIHLQLPGRYDYCVYCKYMAQDVEGESRRHTLMECTKVPYSDGSSGSRRDRWLYEQVKDCDRGADFGNLSFRGERGSGVGSWQKQLQGGNTASQNDYWSNRLSSRKKGLDQTRELVEQALSEEREKEQRANMQSEKEIEVQSNAVNSEMASKDKEEEVRIPGGFPWPSSTQQAQYELTL